MITFKRLSDMELQDLQEARRAQFAQPRLLTNSEIESMKQGFQEADKIMDELLKQHPIKLRAHSATQLKELLQKKK